MVTTDYHESADIALIVNVESLRLRSDEPASPTSELAAARPKEA